MIATQHSIARLPSYCYLHAGYRGSKQPHTMWDLRGGRNGRFAVAKQGWTNGFLSPYLYFEFLVFYFYIHVPLRHGMCVLHDVQYIMLQTWVVAGRGVVLHGQIWEYGAPWGAGAYVPSFTLLFIYMTLVQCQRYWYFLNSQIKRSLEFNNLKKYNPQDLYSAGDTSCSIPHTRP